MAWAGLKLEIIMTKTLAVCLAVAIAAISGCTWLGSQKWTPTAVHLSDPFHDSKYSPL